MTPSTENVPEFDPAAVRDKYEHERAKRMTETRGILYDLKTDERFAAYTRDPHTPFVERDPVADEVDVAIIGGGMAGVVAGAQLRKAGLRRIRSIDQAGGIGGTWYWNRYPGVMCDVESYIYLPMLEELDYVPTHALRVRRGDPPAPRGDRRRGSTWSTTRCSTPASRRAEWDEDARPLA